MENRVMQQNDWVIASDWVLEKSFLWMWYLWQDRDNYEKMWEKSWTRPDLKVEGLKTW